MICQLQKKNTNGLSTHCFTKDYNLIKVDAVLPLTSVFFINGSHVQMYNPGKK